MRQEAREVEQQGAVTGATEAAQTAALSGAKERSSTGCRSQELSQQRKQ